MSLSSSQITIKHESFQYQEQDTKSLVKDLSNEGIKCGEVILLPKRELRFVCSACVECFHSILMFLNHLQNEHFSDVKFESMNEDPLDEIKINGTFIKLDEEEDAPYINTSTTPILETETSIEVNNLKEEPPLISNEVLKIHADTEGLQPIEQEYKTSTSTTSNCRSKVDVVVHTLPKIKKKRNRKKKVNSCHLCPHVARNSSLLETHSRTVHGAGSRFQCEECGKCFAFASGLKVHLVAHSGARPFKCEFCDADFAHYSSLKTHRFIHTGERPYKCHLCDKGFVHSSGLKIHIKQHNGDTPFVCQNCDRKFVSIVHYKRHIISHSDRRAFECNVCGKAFKHKETLKKHMDSDAHTGEKTHVCDVCSKRFSNKKNLGQHKKLHSGIKSYTCKVCKKEFAQNAGLYSHMKSHQNKD